MKKTVMFLFMIALLGSTYYGLKNHFGFVASLPLDQAEHNLQLQLGKVHPLREDQMIVVLNIVENQEAWVERNLASILTQSYPHMRVIYINNGSTDGSLEKAKKYAEDKGSTEKIQFISYDKKRPLLQILYEVIGSCAPHEVIALMQGQDWLAHENVFEHLNHAYANPEVWMTYSRAIVFPDYQKILGHAFPDKVWTEKSLRKEVRETLTPLMTFYAGFFQEIKLQDLLYEGTFIDECTDLALQLPLVEMGPGHILYLDEVSYVKNEAHETINHQLHLRKVAAIESHIRSLAHHSSLPQLKLALQSSVSHRYSSDVIIFSEDSPLHLYACLESLFAKGRDINEIYVLYQGMDQEFQRAYLNLHNEFPTVHFFNVCDYPGNDLPSLLEKAFSNKRHATPYVVFTDDRFIFDERIRFHDCIAAVEKVHSDYFFLLMEDDNERSLPSAFSVEEGIYAFQLGDKGARHSFTPALCRKSLFNKLEGVSDFSSFKKFWQKKLYPESVVLVFEEKKVIPLFDQEASSSQKKEWGYKFIEGYKIDLPSLTCEMDEVAKGEFPLIKREKRRNIVQLD